MLKLAPYLRARNDYEQKVQARKVLADVISKLGSVETEVEKLLCGLHEPNEDAIKAAEGALLPVMKTLASAMKFVDQQIMHAQGSLKDDLIQMRERGQESKTTLDEFHLKIRGQSDQLKLQMMQRKGSERVEKAEGFLEEAIMAEKLISEGAKAADGTESHEAVATCERAAEAAEEASNEAIAHTSSQLKDAHNFPEAARETATDELVQLQCRAKAVLQKVASLQREIADRKTSVLFHEVVVKITEAEEKVAETQVAAEPLTVERLGEVDASRIKAMTERTLHAEKAASAKLVEVRKALAAKQNVFKQKGPDEVPANFAAEVSKIQARIAAAQQALAQHRKAAVTAEKACKHKQFIRDTEEKLANVECGLHSSTGAVGSTAPFNNNSVAAPQLVMIRDAGKNVGRRPR